MVNTFAGPSDKGVYSKSVQQTLYLMADAALKTESSVDKVLYCKTQLFFLIFVMITIVHVLNCFFRSPWRCRTSTTWPSRWRSMD